MWRLSFIGCADSKLVGNELFEVLVVVFKLVGFNKFSIVVNQPFGWDFLCLFLFFNFDSDGSGKLGQWVSLA